MRGHGVTRIVTYLSGNELGDSPGVPLAGSDLGTTAIDAAVAAVLAAIDPAADNRGPVAFKKHVAGLILKRAIARAGERAA